MPNPLFAVKPLELLLREAQETGERSLKRSLGPYQLVALGVGGVIGAGIFTLTGVAAATRAGPALVISFVFAAIGCAFAGLCYSEFSTMIPIAGSAYTYSYATMGELLAWIIGWDLVLEYAVGAATAYCRASFSIFIRLSARPGGVISCWVCSSLCFPRLPPFRWWAT